LIFTINYKDLNLFFYILCIFFYVVFYFSLETQSYNEEKIFRCMTVSRLKIYFGAQFDKFENVYKIRYTSTKLNLYGSYYLI